MPIPNENKETGFTVKIYDTEDHNWKPVYIAPDATDKVQGDVLLSDAIDSNLNAETGMTAATPFAVKKAGEDKISKTSLEEQTVQGKIKFTGGIAVEPGINIDIQDSSGDSVGGGTFTGADMTLTIDDLGDALVPATSEILGGVKIGETVTATPEGVLDIKSVTQEEFNEYFSDWEGGSGGSGSYELPVATSDTLGGVKIGSGVNITPDGIISVEQQEQYSLPIASSTILGGVKIGEGLDITDDGIISSDVLVSITNDEIDMLF